MKKSKKIIVGMPVKAYLKKYVYWKENLSPEEPLDLHSNSNIRMVLDALLTGKFKFLAANQLNGRIVGDYDDDIICKVTPYKENKKLIFFGNSQISWFNSYLYKELHDDLLYAIMLNKVLGIKENKTIHAFMDSVGIYEDISFDGIKKASYRCRKTRNFPVFRFQNCRVGSNPYQHLVLGEKDQKAVS